MTTVSPYSQAHRFTMRLYHIAVGTMVWRYDGYEYQNLLSTKPVQYDDGERLYFHERSSFSYVTLNTTDPAPMLFFRLPPSESSYHHIAVQETDVTIFFSQYPARERYEALPLINAVQLKRG